MGAKCSSPLKKTWFSRKSGNIKKISVSPQKVKPVEDVDDTVRFLNSRTPSPKLSLRKPVSPNNDKHEVKSTVLATGEHNNEEHADEHCENFEDHQEVHYKEIEYSVPAEIKTHYFNSYTQEWYVYKRAQQVPMHRIEPQLSDKDNTSVPSIVDSKYQNIEIKYQNIDGKYQNIDDQYQNIDDQYQNIDDQYQNIDGKYQNIDDQYQNIDSNYQNIDSTNNFRVLFTSSCFNE